jgi:hypothetical protein
VTSVDRSPALEAPARERTDRASRMVSDEDGRVWRVREIKYDDAAPSLVFESDAGFRRVRVYPRSWQTLTERELYALSWRT